MSVFVLLVLLITLLWLVATFVLQGPDLSRFDKPLDEVAEVFREHPDDAPATDAFLDIVSKLRAGITKDRSLKKGFAAVRKFADELSDDLVTDTQFKAFKSDSVDIEWAIPANADVRRRVVFLHGGAFLFGSAKGHRKYADRLAKMLGACVASVNYRMMPEAGRSKTLDDCHHAYQWVLENGPDGPEPLDFLLVAGDSAGGNLALMLSNWSETQALRRPDVVLGFSPSTDVTLASPMLMLNRKTDKLLGEGLGMLLHIPKSIRAWIGLLSMRYNPANPLASPIFGDLSNLPPTLIHASSSEMLLGETIRYTLRAQEAGSNVKLQVWENQIHDWHLFNMGHGSAEVAWNEVAKFVAEHDTRIRKQAAA